MNDYVVVSDIHANASALQQVIYTEGEDMRYIVLGDLMGLLAQPAETLELLNRVNTTTLLAGNHDRAIFEYEEGHVNSPALSRFELEHTLNELSNQQQEAVASLPYLDTFTAWGKKVCAAHAFPWRTKASGYERGNAGVLKRDLPQVASAVSDDYDYVLLGHTHEQYNQDCSEWGHDVTFVNPGTLGYEGEYAVFNPKTGDVELKSIDFDRKGVRRHINSALPDDCPSAHDWFEV